MAALILGTLVAWHVGALVNLWRLVGAGVMPMVLVSGLTLLAWLILVMYDGRVERR
jgi:hypothetical protein